MSWFGEGVMFLIPVAGAIGLFTCIGVIGWASEQRREREAYYRYEFRKKLVDSGKMDASHVHELMRFESDASLWRRRQAMIATGFVLAGVGVGLLLGLQFIEDEVWRVGFIPTFTGLGMIVYAAVFAPKSSPLPPPGIFRDSGGN